MIRSAAEDFEKQKNSLADMKESNTLVNSLIDKFGLEIDGPAPF